MLWSGTWLLERVGARWLLVIAVGTMIPRYLLTASAPSAAWVVAAQTLRGLNFGCWWLAASALHSEHAPPELRNTTQALLPAAAFGVGPLVGLGLAAAVLAGSDTRAVFLAATVLSGVATAFALSLPRTIEATPAE